jgi:hypothetical protein
MVVWLVGGCFYLFKGGKLTLLVKSFFLFAYLLFAPLSITIGDLRESFCGVELVMSLSSM